MKLEAGFYFLSLKNCCSCTQVFNPAVGTGAYLALVDGCSGNRSNRFYVVNIMRRCNQRKDFIKVNYHRAVVGCVLISPNPYYLFAEEFPEYLISREDSILSPHLGCEVGHGHSIADRKCGDSGTVEFD